MEELVGLTMAELDADDGRSCYGLRMVASREADSTYPVTTVNDCVREIEEIKMDMYKILLIIQNHQRPVQPFDIFFSTSRQQRKFNNNQGSVHPPKLEKLRS